MPSFIKWKFGVGIGMKRTVTVTAVRYEDAVVAAREELDRRAYKRGEEPPVAWDLSLLKHWVN
jgi:hypothetical protein